MKRNNKSKLIVKDNQRELIIPEVMNSQPIRREIINNSILTSKDRQNVIRINSLHLHKHNHTKNYNISNIKNITNKYNKIINNSTINSSSSWLVALFRLIGDLFLFLFFIAIDIIYYSIVIIYIMQREIFYLFVWVWDSLTKKKVKGGYEE